MTRSAHALVALFALSFPVLGDGHPSSRNHTLFVPDFPFSGNILHATMIGPEDGANIVHATLGLQFQTDGATPASTVEVEFCVQVDGGSACWVVTGADLGWGSGPGTFTGTISTHELNGVADGFLGGTMIVDLFIGTTTGDGVFGKFVSSPFVLELNSTFVRDEPAISLSAGGSQGVSLDAGAAHAGEFFWILGSVSGTEPGIPVGNGWTLPLVQDPYFNLTLSKPALTPLKPSFGFLDGDGRKTAALPVPPGTDPGLAGLVLNHAYFLYDFAQSSVLFVSVPIELRLLP